SPRRLECARRVDPEEAEVPTDVAEPLVGGSFAAGVEWPHDDGVAYLEPLDAYPELGHPAGHLVPDDLRDRDPVIHGAVRDVQIGPADPAVRDLEPDLAVGG